MGIKEKTMGFDFLDPVARQVDVLWQRNASDSINVFGNKNINETRMMRSVFSMIRPKYECHEGAYLFPYQSNYHIPNSGIFEHWAYDKHLNPIKIADHYKPVLKGYSDHRLLPVYPFRAPFEVLKCKGDHYYMGMLNPHYGHFIQESVTRFWLALNNSHVVNNKTKFVFHVFGNCPQNYISELFNKNISQYLTALGISKKQIVLVSQPCRFENIVIPESSVSISDGNCYMAKEAKTVWAHLNQNMSKRVKGFPFQPPKKIYLSRRKVKNPIQGRILINEPQLEEALERMGFFILMPENYDQNEMQYLLSECDFIAGAPGSGLQNSFFIPNHTITLGITTRPIIDINPGLNHQIHTDIVCGNDTNAYVSDFSGIDNDAMKWKVDVAALVNVVEELLCLRK